MATDGIFLTLHASIPAETMAMQNERVFHYTSIESLGYILQSQKIRFTRLDDFDDVTEAQTYQNINYGRYLFASCWTRLEDESLAQWNMYGNRMEGVRIELPIKPFRQVKLESVPGFTVHPDIQGAFPFFTRELYGDNYLILPMAVLGDRFFQGPVEYVRNVTSLWAAVMNKASVAVSEHQPTPELVVLYDLVRLKSKVWEFQSEYRYYLLALPMSPRFKSNGENIPTVDQMISIHDAMKSNIDTVARYIDVPLAADIFNQLVIRTGPLVTDADRKKIEEILCKFAPNAILAPSRLEGQIRRRKKSAK